MNFTTFNQYSERMKKIFTSISICLFLIACNKQSITETKKAENKERQSTSVQAIANGNCPTPVVCGGTVITTVATVNVYKHNGSNVIMFKAKMYIDADGSPRAYGPNNSGLDYTANAGSPGNWWGIATNGSGTPYIQHAGEPYPGMYVSTTSLLSSSCVDSMPCRYVDSENIPFFVLPSAVKTAGGITIGDVGFVYNTVTGKGCYAIYADAGPSGSIGEGSIYLANQIGINSNARTGGTSSLIIDYIIFPGSGQGQGIIPTVTKINQVGAACMKKMGGVDLTKCL